MKIAVDIIKIGKNLHTWVGISAGIFLFICFFAGGLTMYQHQLSRWAAPKQQQLPKISLQQYNALLSEVQKQYPETKSDVVVNFSSKEGFNAPLQWQAADRKTSRREFNPAQNQMLASLDQHGQLIVVQQNLSKIGWLAEQLHETAGIPGNLGHDRLGLYLMGVVAVLYFLAIMSGLIVLLPTLVKDFFAIRPGKNKKRFWLDTHNVIGISSLPFHIIIATSVIVFAFHSEIYTVLGKLAFKDQPMFPRPKPALISATPPKLDVQALYTKIQILAPDYQIYSMSFSSLDEPNKANVFVALYSEQYMLRGADYDYLSFNPYQSQNINLKTLDPYNSAAEKVIKSLFALHFGNYGGDVTRFIYLLFGLAGAYLFYSGNILWVESRLKKQKNPQQPMVAQRKDVRFMANLTIGACLGCVLALAGCLLLVRGYNLLLNDLQSINHWLIYSYYTLFASSVLYSFVVGAARALPMLLALICICCSLIPMISVIAVIWPQLGMVYHSDLFAIELFSLICAVMFGWFYRRAKLRMIQAPVGSIWATNPKTVL